MALLNSKLIAFWLKHNGKMLSNNYQIYKELLLALPLNTAFTHDQKSFIEVVDKILFLTQSEYYLQNQTKQAKVKKYEDQINHLVNDLYGLTHEEE